MAREFLEDILRQVTRRDIDKVLNSDQLMASAYGKFAEISAGTENPNRPGVFGSKKPNFLSTSIKFEKGRFKEDPVISSIVQKGMYLAPAGKFGTADCCKDKTSGCSAACLHDAGFQDVATQIARTKMLTDHPVEGIALLADEIDNHVASVRRMSRRTSGLFVPAVRLDATSELHTDDMEIGDRLYGGPKGEYQEVHTEGPLKGLPMLMGNEYGKRFAKGLLPGAEPTMRQSNVTRVLSWSEGMTAARADQARSRGLDITGPTVDLGTSAHPKPLPEGAQAVVPFAGGETRTIPAVDYDEHDATGARTQAGNFGVLRAKAPGFRSRGDVEAAKAARFLDRVRVIGDTPVAAPKRGSRRGAAGF